MSEADPTARAEINRRASRRAPLRTSVRVECRKGDLGLGPNLLVAAQDISETGARLVLKAPLALGQSVEVLILGGGHVQPLKRIGRVVRLYPAAADGHCVGVRFDKPVPYAELQSVTRPPRVL